MHLQYSYQYIKTPIFVLNSIYDTAQLAGIYRLPCFPPNCTEEQIQELLIFGSVSNSIIFIDVQLFMRFTLTTRPLNPVFRFIYSLKKLSTALAVYH